MLSKAQYDGVAEPATDELWAIETETYHDEDGNWYRVYPDGWCEQGGTLGTAYATYTNKTFTFLKPFANTDYFTVVMCSHTGDLEYPAVIGKTITSVSFRNTYNRDGYGSWYACGYIA